MKKTTTEGNIASSIFFFFDLQFKKKKNLDRSIMIEEDSDESLSVDSCLERCSHVHDHHDSCQVHFFL